MFNSRVFLAELIGTFAITFVGGGAAIIGSGISSDRALAILFPALATGFALAVFVYAYGTISGSHLNPAVTFGMALNGALKWGQAAFYWIAQFVGAILAGFLLHYTLTTLDATIEGAATVGFLTNVANASTKTYIAAMIVEAILTFFLVNTYLHTSVGGKFVNPFAGWAIGLTMAFSILVGGVLTGASLNPARTFGIALPLALTSKNFATLASPFTYVVYLFGPLIGATLAILVYNFMQGGADVADEVIEVEPLPADESEEAVGE